MAPPRVKPYVIYGKRFEFLIKIEFTVSLKSKHVRLMTMAKFLNELK